MTIRRSSLEYWLPKLPFLSFIGIFLLPIILIKIHYQTGLFFIAFYLSYWTIKILTSYMYVVRSYIRLLRPEEDDISKQKYIQKFAKKLQHIVIIPIYTEPLDVIEESVLSIIHARYHYRDNITILLATEQRAQHAEEFAQTIINNHKNSGINIVNIVHPDGLPGEGKVKGANITYAIQQYEKMTKLSPEETFVSTIDTDTKVEKRFFEVITYTFLTTDYRDQAIYQYTPIYSNNWRQGTFFARIIGMGTTIWQFFESQNPEFYRNFAVYGQSLACLQKADYWDKTSIVEDGKQYWKSYFGWDGHFRTIPTPTICKMDLVDETNLYRTIQSQYKQLRRWSWGCTDVEYVIPQFLKSTTIPRMEKIRKTTYLMSNHLFWASGPFMLSFIGFVPSFFVNESNQFLSIFTVPIMSSVLLTTLFATIIFPSLLSLHIMGRYTHFRLQDYFYNLIQWVTVPVLMLTLFSIPAIESQIRLFFGKRIDAFETTKKMTRK